MIPPELVRKVFVLAYRYFFKPRNFVQQPPLLFKRHVRVAPLFHELVAVVDIEPLPNPRVHPEEFHKDFVAFDTVQPVEIHELRDQRTQAHLHVHPRVLKLFDRRDPLTGGAPLFRTSARGTYRHRST